MHKGIRSFAVIAGAVMIWYGVRTLMYGWGALPAVITGVLTVLVGMRLITAVLSAPRQ